MSRGRRWRARVPRIALGAWLGLTISLVDPTRAESDLCSIRQEISPAAPFAGQAIRWRAHVSRRGDVERADWEEPLRFPDLRVEWLRPNEELGRPDGSSVHSEERTLFAYTAGTYVVPTAKLRCATRGSSGERAVEQLASMPPLSFEVRDVPKSGRPAGWTGLVGRVRVQSFVEPEKLRLGEAARLTVSLRGLANLWTVMDPLVGRDVSQGLLGASALGDRLEWLGEPSELELEPGRSPRVSLRFSAQLIPHAEGTVPIPAVEIAYLDPETERFEIARSPAIELRVLPRGEDPLAERASSRDTLRGDAPAGESNRHAAHIVVALLLAGALGVAVGARVRRRRTRPRR